MLSTHQRDDNIKAIDRPYAYLAMQLEQEPDSLQNIFEIDPLEIPELLGSIGGFWGKSETSHEEAFSKSAQDLALDLRRVEPVDPWATTSRK